MVHIEVPAGTTIYQKGAAGSFYFVLEEGELDLVVGGEVQRSIQTGEGFGEMALLHHSNRPASAIARTKVGLWSLSRHNFKHVT